MKQILLIHGFTGGSWEINPLADRLRLAGYDVYTPTIAGHESTRRELKKASDLDYIASIEDVFLALTWERSVDIIGFSMGSLIAAHLSDKYPQRVSSLTLLSSPVFPIHVMNTIKTLFKPNYLTNYFKKFTSVPPYATQQFRKIVNHSRDKFSSITQPLLLVGGGQDHLVGPRSANFIMSSVQSTDKQYLHFPDSSHLLFHGPDASVIIESILTFLNDHSV